MIRNNTLSSSHSNHTPTQRRTDVSYHMHPPPSHSPPRNVSDGEISPPRSSTFPIVQTRPLPTCYRPPPYLTTHQILPALIRTAASRAYETSCKQSGAQTSPSEPPKNKFPKKNPCDLRCFGAGRLIKPSLTPRIARSNLTPRCPKRYKLKNATTFPSLLLLLLAGALRHLAAAGVCWSDRRCRAGRFMRMDLDGEGVFETYFTLPYAC